MCISYSETGIRKILKLGLIDQWKTDKTNKVIPGYCLQQIKKSNVHGKCIKKNYITKLYFANYFNTQCTLFLSALSMQVTKKKRKYEYICV